MKLARWAGFAVVSVAVGAGAQAPAPAAKLQRAELKWCQGYPCLEAQFGTGTKLRLLLDSGDQASIVDTEAARRLGLATTPALGADGKPVPGYARAVLADLRMGTVRLGDVPVLVSDLAGYMAKNQMPKADGTLAYPAFAERLLEVDYEHSQLRASDRLNTSIACSGACGALELVTFGKHGPPIVVGSGFEINGQRVRAQIDTLFGGSMLIYPAAVARLGLQHEAASRARQFFPYTDGGVTMLRAKATEEGFAGRALLRSAPLYFATPGVHVPDGLFEATVGGAFLAHRVLRLDFHDHWVGIEG